MLSRFVIAFLPRSKHLLISWLQSLSAVILDLKKIKHVTVSNPFPSICYEVIGPNDMIKVFWMLSFKPDFSLSSFTFIKRLYSSSLLSAIRMVSSAYLKLLAFLLAILIPACASSSLEFHMMFSVQAGWQCTAVKYSFYFLNQSTVPCPVLAVASWPAYRFLRRQIRWSGMPISLRIYMQNCFKW